MDFTTAVDIPKSELKINHSDTILMFGSCFIENIGTKLIDSKFNVAVNPFGVLYNPQSINSAIRLLIENKKLAESDLFRHNGMWHSFIHHSIFSNANKETCLKNINFSITQSAERLRKSDILFVTFGTAYIYSFKETGETVGNCHKLPADKFERRRLGVEEIVESWIFLIKQLRTINPKLRIIFTVSPIRHLKDGAHQNQLSKATLLLAIEKIMKETEAIEYFPAYEIVVDELRDYRFYAEDMTHPSFVAIKYIWERFSNTYFDSKTQQIIREWAKLASAIGHRSLSGKSDEYKYFLQQTLLKVNLFQEKYPYICCKREINSLNETLSSFH